MMPGSKAFAPDIIWSCERNDTDAGTILDTGEKPYFERDFDRFIRERGENGESLEMISLLLRDMMNREEGKVAPDTYGADKFFLDGFLNEDMDYDFMAIACDFLKHNFDRLKEFNDLEYYGNDRCELSDPERALHVKILDIIYNFQLGCPTLQARRALSGGQQIYFSSR